MSNFTLTGDGKDWARKIMVRIDYGYKVGHYAAWCAREALKLPHPEQRHRLSFDARGRVRTASDASDQQALAA